MHYSPLTFGVCATMVLCAVWAAPVQAEVAFGNDSSSWALDGECDDPRFVGEGMADVLLDEDRLADATDCRVLFDAGYIRLRSAGMASPGTVDFGADTSEWAFDGECDDPRFAGKGMASVLLDEDRLADATDCRVLFEAGRIHSRVDGGRSLARDGVRASALQPGVGAYGLLGRGDDMLDAGEYCDYFTFQGSVGAIAVVELRADEFDPYLIVRAPSGEQFDNDDYDGDASRAVVTFPMQESGTYTIGVTSYQADEAGSYAVLLEIRADAVGPAMRKRVGELQVRAVAPAKKLRQLAAGLGAAAPRSVALQ